VEQRVDSAAPRRLGSLVIGSCRIPVSGFFTFSDADDEAPLSDEGSEETEESGGVTADMCLSIQH